MSKIVRLVFTEKIYQKHRWVIPITQSGSKFITGQNLETEKMTGVKPLSEEEAKKYPFVINPLEYYKANHRDLFDLDEPGRKTLYDLAILSGEIASNKIEFDKSPAKFKGYFDDAEAQAIEENKKLDMAFEAEKLVRELPVADYKATALLVNYKLGQTINYKTGSPDYIRNRLLDACRINPEKMLTCFAKKNPDIGEEKFILDLVANNIIMRKPNGEFYDGVVFLGNSIEEVKKRFLNDTSKEMYVSKWQNLLNTKKGIAEPVKTANHSLLLSGEINKVKSLLFDGKEEEAIKLVGNIFVTYKDVISDEQKRELDEILEKNPPKTDKRKKIKED